MQKRNLSKQKICHAAIDLIEQEGLEQLTMRKLASKLNIEAASLYNHIANKSELFDSIQEFLYATMPILSLSKNWKEHLSQLAISTRQGLLNYPKVSMLFATRPTITDTSLNQANITLTILINAGFKKKDVLAIFRNLHVFVLGHVMAEGGVVPGEKDNSNEPSIYKINIDRFPTLKKVSTNHSPDFEKGFKLGLECMLNGLENLLRGKNKC